MSNSEWNKVDFQTFIDEFSKRVIVENAPTILYSKKDKEHEALNSLITFFFLTGGLFIFISLSIFFRFAELFAILFVTIIVIAAAVDIVLIFYYLRSHVPIRLLENWVEVYKGSTQENNVFYCLSYYPVFSGKCHPNKAKNVLYKLLQEELFNSSIDITQIEVYLSFDLRDLENYIVIGYNFQYGEGVPYKSIKINRSSWKFFPREHANNENFIAVANWDHQYEWRNDLELDYDKLHSYAPWVIQKWDEITIKPLIKLVKNEVKWDLRGIESTPKLKPWESNFEKTRFDSFKAYKDLQLMNDAIEKVIGKDIKIEKLKDIKKHLLEFKAYLRDLNS
ncbi:MAG: hypothetical protein HWN80_08270 [Candidatus Lokiarchaeota archaeon]|nr:hypothetical protein [Candidatus Lokiarchaeota archaeon]